MLVIVHKLEPKMNSYLCILKTCELIFFVVEVGTINNSKLKLGSYFMLQITIASFNNNKA